MPKLPPLVHKETHAPSTAPILAAPFKRRLDPDVREALAWNCWNTITTAWAARRDLEENLRKYDHVLEMIVAEKNTPWVGCSNIVPPVAISKFQTLLAQIVNMVFVPEFYIVAGEPGDVEAQQDSYTVQRRYNYELRMERPDMLTWYEEHIHWLGAGLLDGVSVMEIMWKYKERRARYGMLEPDEDEEGMPLFDENGEPKMRRVTHTEDVVDYDDVVLQHVRLKDIGVIPAEAPSIAAAVAVWRNKWYYEADLKAMVEDGILDAEWVEKALAYVPSGTSDIAQDRQGTYDKSAGGQINTGQAQGGLTKKGLFSNRGPIKVVMLHSRQFDVDGDKWPEENVFFVHEPSGYLLGWCPDNYIAPSRPFRSFAPHPRIGQWVGWSLIEWLTPLQSEAATIRNQRNDAVDRAIAAPLVRDASMDVDDKEFTWSPGTSHSVRATDGKRAADYVSQVQVQFPPAQTYQEEQFINTYADQVSGLSAPIEGAATSSRRTATEIKARQTGTTVRASLVAMYFRFAARGVIQFVHNLKRQFPGQKTSSGIDPEIFRRRYQIDVAGTNDPLNVDENVQEALEMYNLLRQDPDIMQSAVRRYELKKYMFQATHTKDFEGILGTKEDAEQKDAMQAQMAQQQMAAAQAGQAPAGPGGAPPPNAPGLPGQHPGVGGGAGNNPLAALAGRR
jgi:hypothetical protein